LSVTLYCPGCQRQYTHPLELTEIRAVGLALTGQCPGCGTRFGLNATWNCRARFDYQPNTETENPPDPPKPAQPSLL